MRCCISPICSLISISTAINRPPQEESSNQAHYRGRCLDGIEGRGRTLLLRDTRLQH